MQINNQKMSLSDTIMDELTKEHPDPYALCGFVELLTGGSSTKQSFKGEMLRLRHENNGNIELLMHIAECLDAIITQKQKDPYADQTEIALFESAMLDAKQTYTDLLEVLRVINRVDPVAVAMEHANNQLTAAADLHNAHNAA